MTAPPAAAEGARRRSSAEGRPSGAVRPDAYGKIYGHRLTPRPRRPVAAGRRRAKRARRRRSPTRPGPAPATPGRSDPDRAQPPAAWSPGSRPPGPSPPRSSVPAHPAAGPAGRAGPGAGRGGAADRAGQARPGGDQGARLRSRVGDRAGPWVRTCSGAVRLCTLCVGRPGFVSPDWSGEARVRSCRCCNRWCAPRAGTARVRSVDACWRGLGFVRVAAASSHRSVNLGFERAAIESVCAECPRRSCRAGFAREIVCAKAPRPRLARVRMCAGREDMAGPGTMARCLARTKSLAPCHKAAVESRLVSMGALRF